MVRGNFTLEQPWRQDVTSQQDDKASEQNKYIIALASTHGALQPGKSLGLTVAKNCLDSENGCKRFGGHILWASAVVTGDVCDKRQRIRTTTSGYTYTDSEVLKCSDKLILPGLITLNRMPNRTRIHVEKHSCKTQTERITRKDVPKRSWGKPATLSRSVESSIGVTSPMLSLVARQAVGASVLFWFFFLILLWFADDNKCCQKRLDYIDICWCQSDVRC